MLIDEVHTLNEDRGAVLEAVVSRMKLQQHVTRRYLAISATAPNLEGALCCFVRTLETHAYQTSASGSRRRRALCCALRHHIDPCSLRRRCSRSPAPRTASSSIATSTGTSRCGYVALTVMQAPPRSGAEVRRGQAVPGILCHTQGVRERRHGARQGRRGAACRTAALRAWRPGARPPHSSVAQGRGQEPAGCVVCDVAPSDVRSQR